VKLAGMPAWGAGLAIAVFLVPIAAVALPAIAWLPVFVGLYFYEWAFIRAAQLPPLS